MVGSALTATNISVISMQKYSFFIENGQGKTFFHFIAVIFADRSELNQHLHEFGVTILSFPKMGLLSLIVDARSEAE